MSVSSWTLSSRANLKWNADTFDIYFTRDHSKIFLIDFNSFAPQTDSLLFDWAELLSVTPNTPELPILRLINSATEAAQSMPRYSHNRYPKDVVELSDGKSVAEFARDWQEQMKVATEL